MTGPGIRLDRLRVGPAALKTGSECSFTAVNSASSPVFALHGSSSLDQPKARLKAGFVFSGVGWKTPKAFPPMGAGGNRVAVFHPTLLTVDVKNDIHPTNTASPSRFVDFTRQSMDYSALREALGSREDFL
ncbi:hypothetical protein EA798_20215 [Pseudomonas songnenensis]|uniref:Uncharacterized protein n=1 Tax=Pseudomonas songnenensis TaxID=1176259 RepID=A0ABX9UNA9_9PSED|nr:hypothetical protein EA798_20215 [Pseudomonas songnenensis]